MEDNKNYNYSSQQSTPVEKEATAMAGFEAEIKEIKKGPNRVLFLILGLVGLILLFSVSGLFLILSGGENNPLSVALGLDGSGAIGLVYIALGLAFGAIGVAGLLTGLFGVFKFMNTAKTDKVGRKKSAVLGIAGLVAALIGLSGLLFAFNQINNTNGRNELIRTNPAITTGLTAPISITFSGENVPIDRDKYDIIAYTWDFGNGEDATGPLVTHTFNRKPASGVYTVTLTVRLQEVGNVQAQLVEQKFTRLVAIENEKVFASFKFSPEEGEAPLRIEFDASDSQDPDGNIVKYEWDFNSDGIFDREGVETNYTFEEDGDYAVVLKVTDNNGEINTIEHIVVVGGSGVITPVITTLPADEVLAPNRAYQFDASDSTSAEGNITSYAWDFGDGNRQTGRRVSHSYRQEGVYEISLTLRDDQGNTKTLRDNYAVSADGSGLFARIATSPRSGTDRVLRGQAPLKVSFDAGASSGGSLVDFEWDFENDEKVDAKGQKADYTFTKAGTYDVALTVTTADNKTAKTSQRVIVEAESLEAKLTANPVSGIVPLTVTFDATATKEPEGENIVAFRWDFGDGTPLLTEGPIVNHRFAAIGTFKVEVTVITASNKTATASTNITVTSTPLRACYTMSRKSGPAPLTVTFNPQCSTGTISAYTWKFDAMNNSNERRPTYTFEAPGTYEVELEVSDSGNNVNKFVDTVIVE